jgi:hypothetical protein
MRCKVRTPNDVKRAFLPTFDDKAILEGHRDEAVPGRNLRNGEFQSHASRFGSALCSNNDQRAFRWIDPAGRC